MKHTSVLSALLVGASVAVGTVATIAAPAQAVLLSCVGTNYDISGKVTDGNNQNAASACIIGDDVQDSVSPPPSSYTVNQDQFFNFNNWELLGKIGTGILSTAGSGSGQSGTWNIGSFVQNTWTDIMLVFKDGGDTTIVGYLLKDNITSGSWSTPFTEPPFNFPGNNPRDVSHISVYYRTGTPVPEPITMFGLGVGLVGGGVLKQKYGKKANKEKVTA